MKYFLIFMVLFSFIGCSSDYHRDLGDGYMYRSEGSTLNDILHKDGEIPANVLCYSYNKEFILAIQKPISFQDPLYEKLHTYPNGDSTVYYWIVIKESCFIWGPLNRNEFDEIVQRFNVPKKLIKKIDNYKMN